MNEKKEQTETAQAGSGLNDGLGREPKGWIWKSLKNPK